MRRDEYDDPDDREVKAELKNWKYVMDVYNKRRTDDAFPEGPEGD